MLSYYNYSLQLQFFIYYYYSMLLVIICFNVRLQSKKFISSDLIFKLAMTLQYNLKKPGSSVLTKKYTLLFKFVLTLPLVFCFLLYRNTFKEAFQFQNCLRDRYQEITNVVNAHFINLTADIALGIGQLIIDSAVVGISIFWIIKVKNFRIIASYAFFFGVRSIFLSIEKFPFNDQLVWHNPGFFSLTVPYDLTRDFYYSGHTGTMTLLLLEFQTLKMKKTSIVVGVSLFYIINLLLISRVHYTTDIIGGAIFALFFFAISKKCVFYIDKIFSIPYYMYSILRKKCSSVELTPQVELNNEIEPELPSPSKDESQNNDMNASKKEETTINFNQ